MNSETLTIAAIFVLALAFGGVFLWALLVKLEEFREDLDYINMEIRRSTGETRKRWIKRRRQLYLSLLPFYRRK